MKNKATGWCYISAVVCYISGVFYSFSLIFLPVAIYCFVYGNRYLRIAKLTDYELSVIKSMLISSAVFLSIFAFPIGLVSIIPVCMSGSNAKVSNEPRVDNSTTAEQAETVKAQSVEVNENIEQTQNVNLSDEDLEKIEKLSAFRNQGLLTEQEFEDAKRQIMNKK